MILKKETIYKQDLDNKKLIVLRHFDAAPEKVWKAWTEPALLDQWWAPKPWKAETKSMDFREGGTWLYAMVGPEGEQHFARVLYHQIEPVHMFSGHDGFCDADGNPDTALPGMEWTVQFKAVADGTDVEVEVAFASIKDLETIVEMGFKEGFAMAHDNLDELLLG
ncbi:MAG: SRPBCC domain-containing protein [Chitinophagales bacterium]